MKPIGLYILGDGEKAKIQVEVADSAHAIYKDAGTNKSGLVELLLIDAYANDNYSMMFKSKRLGLDSKGIAGNPHAIYEDAGRCKSALIEGLLLEASRDEKYFVFLKSKRAGVSSKPVINNEDAEDGSLIDEEELNFDHLGNEEEEEKETWN